jgi:receptor expression-enhancing protein 1/2/3/4
VKEYVRWMMHWVVFSCFVTLETFSDMFISWFPFYYEAKLLVVFWLLSPMTKGSSILYKKFVHPKLSRHEQEIDEYISQAKERGYKTVIDVGTKTFDFASKLIVETAIKVSKTFQ